MKIREVIDMLERYDPETEVWHQSTGGIIEEGPMFIRLADEHDQPHVPAGSVVVW